MRRNRHYAYWTLFCRDLDGKWSPQFGALTRGEVMQEAQDSYPQYAMKDRAIVGTHSADQVYIDAAQKRLQGQWLRKDGMPMDTHDMMEAFGLPPNSPIPPHHTDVRLVGEVWVQIIARDQKGKKGGLGFPNRRVIATCPICSEQVCAGHLHQHVGTRTCLTYAARWASPKGWDVAGGPTD
jgi:hypothetical protein